MLHLLLAASLLAAPPVQDAEAAPPPELTWRSVEEATVEGRGWSDLAAPYDRLPARAQGVVRAPVWRLQRDSAGMCARFVTDATEIEARWTLTDDSLAMPHMPATGVSGLDLYGRDAGGAWRWVGVGRPAGLETSTELAGGLDGVEREYLLYLPLYNGVASVELGLPAEASFDAGPARPSARAQPVVFYGTSITQGGCASRPGMVHTAQLGRWLDRPVINLGFSGQGRMDLELAPLIGELDAALFVVDCLPNLNGPAVAERTGPFVRALRAARPSTPILLVEDRLFTNSPFHAGLRGHHAANHAALREAHAALVAEGVTGLHYLEGAELLGQDGEATVDGSHPTDLGFVRQARAFEPVLRELLDQPTPLRVLLLGDSISIGYTPFVREALAGRAHVVRPTRGAGGRAPENCEGTNNGVQHVDRWLALEGGDWDVIHFNFGLHDLKRVDPVTGQNSTDPSHPHQADPARYGAQLRDIVAKLEATGATLVFATSTPVPAGDLRPHREPADAVRYNEVALGVMREAGVQVNDLYAFVEAHERPLQRPLDVHFTEQGSRALGARVVEAILETATAARAGANAAR